jgi:protein SCO1/2
MNSGMRHAAVWIALAVAFPLLAHAHTGGQWVRKEASGAAPDFTLTNQDGEKVSLRDLRGKVVVVNFIFTHCESGCLVSTAKLKDVQNAFKNKPFQLVSITFDPAHDTPAALKEYAKRFRADLANWSFLTGTPEEIEPVLFDYKIEVNWKGKKGPTEEIVSVAIVDHGMKSYVIDQTGAKRFEYWGQDFDTKVVIKDLTKVFGDK